MANPKIRFKRSSVPNKIPSVSDLPLGEIAINTNDGEIYIARERPGIGTDIVRVGAGATVINVLYVTQDGNDNNTGKKLGDAKRTIKAAVAESVPGTVIKISAGVYLEDNPIVLPDNVSVVGDSLREVTVTPKNQGDLFWLDNGCYIAEMSFIGPEQKSNGAIVTFNPEVVPYIDQSPYIQNCTNFIPGTIGLNIDGEYAIGPIKSMVLDSYTQINPGGLGAKIFNEAFAQLVSMFTICSDTAILCQSGGACDLTNSNSSFGNFGLVADGVGPLKYTGIVTTAAGVDASVFKIKVDANAPVMNVVDAKYDFRTGIGTFVLDREHKLSVGMGVTIAGLGFTCDSDGGATQLEYPTGNYGYIFETRTVAPGRYVDASESIEANRTEILDKSLASIAFKHPDFYFPGEAQTNASSRFYDSYRLIQQNKQEIVDRSLAEISVNHPDFYFPNDLQTNARSRFFDSYRLIQQNKQEIIDRSLASISLENPDFYFPDSSRNRFKDSYNLVNANRDELIDKSLATISLYHPDFFFPDDPETNERSRFFDSYRLILDNKQEIVDKALAGISFKYDMFDYFLFPGDTETTSRSRFYDSYRLIQQNKQEIVDKSLASVALNYDQFYFPGDLETNARSRFADSYRLIQQNKQEIIDKSLGAIAIDHPDFYFPGDDQTTGRSRFYDSYRLIQQNRQEIVDKSLAAIALDYHVSAGVGKTFAFPGDEYTNARSRFFDSYRLIQTNRRELIDRSIGNIVVNYDQYPTDWVFPGDDVTNARSRYYDSYRLIQKNKTDIVNAAWTATRNQYPAILSTETKCKRDLGYFVDAVSLDVLTGGNSYSQDFTLQYFSNNQLITNGIDGEEVQSIYAFNQARDKMYEAITNNLSYTDSGITTSPGASSNSDSAACQDVQDTIATLVLIITEAIANEQTGSFAATRNVGYFAQAGIGTTSTPGGFKCARDIGYFIDSVSTDVFTGGNVYSREFILEYFDDGTGQPIGEGLYEEEIQSLYGFIGAGEFMKDAITNQLYTKNLGISSGPAVYNGPGIAYTVYQSGNADACQDVQDTIDTLVGIVTSVVGLGTTATAGDVTATINQGYFVASDAGTPVVGFGTTSSPGGFKCARDTGFFIDAISIDLFTAGNYYSDGFALQYFDNAAPIINGLLGEEGPSIVAFEAAGEYMKDAITNQLFNKDVGISSGTAYFGVGTTNIPVLRSGNANACLDVQDNIDSLVGIVTVAVGLGTTGQLPTTTGTLDLGEFNQSLGISTFSPGGFTCGRDVRFLVDAISTDLFTGGNAYAAGFLRNQFKAAAGWKPTDATYDPATGDFTAIIGAGHPLQTNDVIYLDKEGFTFTCAMDGNKTEHALPTIGQLAYTNGLTITGTSATSFTVNVGASGTDWSFNPTAATYDPATGDFTVTVGEHSLSVGEGVIIEDNSFTFSCAMDGFQAQKTYPRPGIDPFAGRSVKITSVTSDTLTVNVGASGPNKYFTPTAADYNAATGDLTVTVGQHGLGVGRGVILEDNSFVFTCDQDGNATQHSYPRSTDPISGVSTSITAVGMSTHTVTNATYDAASGDVVLTVASHGFTKGDYIKLDDASLTFTCVLDDNTVSKAYPRAGYDYASGRWLEISEVTPNTFKINIGASSYTGAHTFVSATANGLKKQTGTFTINVGDAGIAAGSVHTFVYAEGNAIRHEPQTTHQFVSASAGAVKHLPQSAHTFVRATTDSVKSYEPAYRGWITSGLAGEEAPSNSAFIAAGGLIKKALTNQLYRKDVGISSGAATYGGAGGDIPVLPSGNINSCQDVQDNVDTLVGIVTAVVGLGTTATFANVTTSINTGYYDVTAGIGTTSSPGGFKCARDLGFLVDAVSTDIHAGGNTYTRDFSLLYFDGAGNPISNGLVGEEAQSLIAFESASGYMKQAITNQLNAKDVGISSGKAAFNGPGGNIPVLLSGNAEACTDVQAAIENLVGIATVAVGLGTTTSLPAETKGNFLINTDPFTKLTIQNTAGFGNTTPGGVKCARDVGYLVDALAIDVFTGGNSYSRDFTLFYFDGAGNPTTNGLLGEEAPSIVAFDFVADLAKKAVTNQLNRKDVGISSGPATYVGGGTSEAVLPSGNANACQDVQDNIDTIVGIVTVAIGAGATTGLPTLNEGYFNQAGIGTTSSPGGFKCARDLGYLADAVAGDLYTGGNKNIVGFALSYFDGAGNPITNGLLGEESESVTAFTAFGDLSRAAVTNQLNAQDLTLSPDWVTGDNRNPDSCADVQNFIENLVGIATVAVGLGTTTSLPVVNKGFDERDDEQYRYFDSYRLIQQNRQEVIDRSIGSIAQGYDAYDTFFFPGDLEENARSRFYDAYRMIQLNKDVIVGLAFTDAVNNPNFNAFNFSAVEDKCKRDTGFFIDAISLDVLIGANKYATEFTLQYFDGAGNPITGGLVGEEEESIFVFQAAAKYMKNALTNNLVGAAYSDLTVSAGGTYFGVGSDVTNTDPTACLDIQDQVDTLTGIVTATVSAGNTTGLPTITGGIFDQSVSAGATTPGGYKCARDIGFFVDAVSTDVFIAGNKYSQEFTLQYFNESGAVYIDGGEVAPTVVGLGGAGEFMKDALTNQLYRKDVGISSGPATYGGPGVAHTVFISGNALACQDVQDNVDTLVGIVTVALGAGTTASLSGLTYNTGIFDRASGIGSTENPGGYKCARDLGFLIDAVATDVFSGGNIYSRGFSEQYYYADGTKIRGGLEGEEVPSLTAFRYSGEFMKDAITNQLYRKDLTLSTGPANYGGVGIVTYTASGNENTCQDVQGNIDNLVGIITTVIGAGNTSDLYDGTIGVTEGYFTLNLGEFGQTVGFGTTAGDLVGLGTTSSPGGYKCARDIGYLVDAVATDVFVGGNTYSKDFARQYFDGNGRPITPGLNAEKAESVTAFIAAGDLMAKAVSNQLYAKDLTLTFGPEVYGSGGYTVVYTRSGNPDACQDVQDFISNRIGIITESIGIGTLTTLDNYVDNPGSFLDQENKCRRDIGYFVTSVRDDLENSTNANTIAAVNYYFDEEGEPLAKGLLGEEVETVTAFRASADYMQLAINNQLNNKNFDLLDDAAYGSNNTPEACQNVQDTIDNLIGIATDAILKGEPSPVRISAASTFFTANVGKGPFAHYYTPGSGGTVQINAQRPFDGQVAVFDKLYYQLDKIQVTNGGSGYTETPEVTIADPTTEWGVPAQAIATVENGSVISVEVVSSGRGFVVPPAVTIAAPQGAGGVQARIVPSIYPSYFTVSKATLPDKVTGISTVTFDTQVPYDVGVGMDVYFYKQSRVLASSHAFEYIGSGINVKTALPQNGGVTIPENETVNLNGGLVVFTSTDQSGNFKIGDGLIINQNTGTISGTSYSKSLFSTLTPFILALGGE